MKCTLGAALGASLALPQEVIACGGSRPAPVCSRSTALIKAAPAMIVLPASPAPVSMPIPVTVVISALGTCPAPLTTSVTLTGACTLIGGGPAPGGSGVAVFPTPAPGIYPGFGVLMTFAAGPARACLISGTAATTWAGGSVTTGMGDQLVCLVDAVPGMPGVPRLDLELLTPPIESAHPGDQRISRWRLTNNDPTESVTITFDVESEQTARLSTQTPPPLPGSGDAPYSISDPGTGDNFPIAFGEDLLQDFGGPDTYILDDGTAVNGLGLPTDAAIIWLNQFDVQAGESVIDRISVAYGPGANGQQVSLVVLDDPNNDGNPNDATLLTLVDSFAASGGTDTFIDTLIPPTHVGSTGDSFFVGVVMQEAPGGSLPAAHDPSGPQGQSWIGADASCGIDAGDVASLATALAEVGTIGFPGDFLIRARGANSAQPLRWVELPPDPPSFSVPTISRTLTLCPGESRDIDVAIRSWPMCRTGSCGETRVQINGTFSDGSAALACGGAALFVDTNIPPDFLCPDGGSFFNPGCEPFEGRVIFSGEMPTHEWSQQVQVLSSQIFPKEFPPLFSQPPQCEVLNQDDARLSIQHVGPLLTDVPFQVVMEVQSQPVPPTPVQTELLELHLHSASPIVGDSYFHILARHEVTAPSIPLEVESFFDVFSTLTLSGSSGTLHLDPIIEPSSIQVLPLGPDLWNIQFNAVFPTPSIAGGLPLPIDSVVVYQDMVGVATGIPPAPFCPPDINGDGLVNGLDLGILLANWSIPAGSPGCGGALPCPSDINGDGVVDGLDLGTLLANWSIPPDSPGCL